MNARIPFFLHDLGRAEAAAFENALLDPILTTGEAVARFERRFAETLGRRHAIAVQSCTAALQLSLQALGVGPGDEVITTPLTFIASSTAILQAGATPVFVDVEPETGNIDASRIERAITARTRAILPVHLYGQMCDMRALRAIADAHDLRIVEDAAHCVEGRRDGIGPAQLGEAACFSFYATKAITCGEGGAIVTDDDALAERLRRVRMHGMTKAAADRAREGYQHWDMVEFGWKYNLDNLHAAILLPQLARLEANLARRRELAAEYERALAGVPGLTWPMTLPGVEHARHLFTAWVREGRRDELIAGLQTRGIGAMVNYRAIHLLSYFRERFGHTRGAFPNAERIGDETVSLPLYPRLTPAEVRTVARAIGDVLGGTAAERDRALAPALP
ncbi:MAG TPA: DegT/DnrJ/EryC1/StrS family aminotransferase [Candidatus Acidoferrales bacterium]|nr:DegT/DnrJ/EryC1/StrS family aminotransferase [Candidatus Acidoferrales bacterium]